MEKQQTMKEVWSTLSSLDLSKFIQKKMGLSYVSWAGAWECVMSKYPTAQFNIKDAVTFGDGSMEVWTSVEIEGHNRAMWLPVMDHKNNAIKCPNARQISDARMRCLVKNLAMFGLGLYVYRGEDLPTQPAQPVKTARPTLAPATQAWDRAKAAYMRGDLDKVKAAMIVTPEIEAQLVKECSG